MHKLYDLKEMLCEELEEYGAKDKLDVGGLDVVDKLAHTIKNLDKIIKAYEDNEYSERNMSYARNIKRDSMGRYSHTRRGEYSRNSDILMELHELMKDAPDEKTRREFQKFISKIEDM